MTSTVLESPQAFDPSSTNAWGQPSDPPAATSHWQNNQSEATPVHAPVLVPDADNSAGPLPKTPAETLTGTLTKSPAPAGVGIVITKQKFEVQKEVEFSGWMSAKAGSNTNSPIPAVRKPHAQNSDSAPIVSQTAVHQEVATLEKTPAEASTKTLAEIPPVVPDPSAAPKTANCDVGQNPDSWGSGKGVTPPGGW